MGEDVAFYDTDVSLPRQFWSMTYDAFTAPGLPNFIANVPPSLADPAFTNRTRSLLLSLQNPVRPTQLGLMDTYSSVVSANLHLQNGITGAIFLSKKADRDVASIGTNPVGAERLPAVRPARPSTTSSFSPATITATLKGCPFELIDQGYAMCLVDDGSGTGTKVAKYFIDSDGNYNELYTYVLYSPNGGILETASFTLKVTLGSARQPGGDARHVPATPNNVNPQDLVAQINKVSNLIYAAFGPSSPGQPPAYHPDPGGGRRSPGRADQRARRVSTATTSMSSGANRQPMQISQIYSGSVAYPIAGSTTIVPSKDGQTAPFYGSLSHGLDKQVSVRCSSRRI